MNPALSQAVRIPQILVGALLAGVIGLTVAALLMGPVNPPPPTTPGAVAAPAGPFGGIDPLLLALGALMVAQVPTFVVFGATFARRAASMAANLSDEPESRERALSALWVNSIIVRAAFAEGTGLFAGIVLLLSGERLALVGVGFSVVVLLGLLPTRGRLENFIQRAVHAAALIPLREVARR